MSSENREESPIKKVAPTSIDWNRTLSLWLAIAYLLIALIYVGVVAFTQMLLYLIIPMACIWYGDAMGSITGGSTVIISGGPAITKQTPWCIMNIGGWLILLLPIIKGVIILVGMAAE